jgi:hypothetical protein
LRRQVDAKTHAATHRLVEVRHPVQVCAELQVSLRVELELLAGRRRRIGADVERTLHGCADLVEDFLVVTEAEQHQPFGQQFGTRRLHPRARARIDVVARGEEHHGEANIRRLSRERGRRCLAQVVRSGVLHQLRGARRTDGRHQRRIRGFLERELAIGLPRRGPEVPERVRSAAVSVPSTEVTRITSPAARDCGFTSSAALPSGSPGASGFSGR